MQAGGRRFDPGTLHSCGLAQPSSARLHDSLTVVTRTHIRQPRACSCRPGTGRVGSRAPAGTSGHPRGTRSRSNEGALGARDERTPVTTMAKPRHDLDGDPRRPRRSGIPRRQPSGRREPHGRSTPRHWGAAAAGRRDCAIRGRDAAFGSNSSAVDRSRHTALRVATSRGRNRLPRRAVQRIGAHLSQRNGEAGDSDSETLALRREPPQARTRRVPLVRLARRERPAQNVGARSGETRGSPSLEPVCMALCGRPNTLQGS